MSRGGRKNFEICPHKRVELDYFEGIIVGAGLTCPRTEEKKLAIEVAASGISFPDTLFWAVQNYSNTKDKPYAWRGYKAPEVAYKHLARTAGQIVCAGCDYPRITPVELSETRARQAEAALEIVENDKRRLKALESLQAARIELEQIVENISQGAELPPTE